MGMHQSYRWEFAQDFGKLSRRGPWESYQDSPGLSHHCPQACRGSVPEQRSKDSHQVWGSEVSEVRPGAMGWDGVWNPTRGSSLGQVHGLE